MMYPSSVGLSGIIYAFWLDSATIPLNQIKYAAQSFGMPLQDNKDKTTTSFSLLNTLIIFKLMLFAQMSKNYYAFGSDPISQADYLNCQSKFDLQG